MNLIEVIRRGGLTFAFLATACGGHSPSIYPSANSETFSVAPAADGWMLLREPGWYSVQMMGKPTGTETFQKVDGIDYSLKRMVAQGGGPKFIVDCAEFGDEKLAEKVRRTMSTDGVKDLRETSHAKEDAIVDTKIESRIRGKRVFILQCLEQVGGKDCDHFVESFHMTDPTYGD